jgi:hypothetical protein
MNFPKSPAIPCQLAGCRFPQRRGQRTKGQKERQSDSFASLSTAAVKLSQFQQLKTLANVSAMRSVESSSRAIV